MWRVRSRPYPSRDNVGMHATVSADADMAGCAGHTSWSTSGLGFLTLWLLGKLRVYDGAAHPARLVAACVPICLAGWIGITRLQVL